MVTVEKLRPEINIVNTVSTADMKQKVDLTVFNNYPFLESNLELYRCGYVKDDRMVGRVTIFASGKMISVGTKSPKRSFIELRKAKRILLNYKMIKPCKIEPKTVNIVGNTRFEEPIHIEKLARTLPKSIYEPEQFPGIIYRIGGSLVSLIFSSGKIVIVGATSINELNSAHFHLKQSLF